MPLIQSLVVSHIIPFAQLYYVYLKDKKICHYSLADFIIILFLFPEYSHIKFSRNKHS